MTSFLTFTAAFAVLIVYLFWWWWRQNHKAKPLIGGILAPVAIGVLLRACGGLAGQAADAMASAADTASGIVAEGIGTEGGAIPTGTRTALTPGGGAVTLALLLCALMSLVVAAKRAGGGPDALRMLALATVGVVMYSTAGGADWGDSTIVAAVNGLGAPITDWAYGRYA